MTDEPRYSLTELADLGGVTPRTVRYYLGQGLLPAVGPSGPGSKYGTTHLARLRLIRRLQTEHLPLAEIRRRLDDLDEAAIRDLAAQERPSPPQDSALDYLRGVLGPSGRSPSSATSATPAASAAAMSAPALAAAPEPAGRPLLARAPVDAASPSSAVGEVLALTAPVDDSPTPPVIERSQWDRIAVAPDVEIHIRRPLARAQQKGVDRLVAIARELLEEERP
jgi:DNA-binding transcriptional MerR regulator